MSDIDVGSGEPTSAGTHYVHSSYNARARLAELRAENRYYPYDCHAQYACARSLSTPRLESATLVKRIAVDGSPAFIKEEAAFSSHRDFVSRLDEMMECQTPWEAVTIADKDARESWAADLRYWKRDSLAVLQEILENTALVDKCVWGPSKRFNADNERVYTHMDSRDWWWNMQALTPLKDILMLGKNASY